MRRLEEYLVVGQKRLRCGYTTGTCAAAAARAAAEMLLSGAEPCAVRVETPAGIDVVVDVEDALCGGGWAECAVRKDAGDDADATDGALVYARVTKGEAPGVSIDGGQGVGRVTKPGLDQPVGAAAINTVPRQMIAEQVHLAARAAGYDGGLSVVISVPEGERIAAKTFNPRLGIEGGISVLGTSGIVRPMSEDALVASIRAEMDMRAAVGVRDLLVCPGNYGHDFAMEELGLSADDVVQCSNYLGPAIDYAVLAGFRSFLLVGHIGKMAKVAAGAMNTHSKVADGRREAFAAHTALVGASAEVVRALMEAATTDAMVDALDAAGLREPVMRSMAAAIDAHLKRRAGDGMRIEAVFFSRVHGLLGATPGAEELLRMHRRSARRGGGESREGGCS